jgi:hypothetical protein
LGIDNANRLAYRTSGFSADQLDIFHSVHREIIAYYFCFLISAFFSVAVSEGHRICEYGLEVWLVGDFDILNFAG